MYTTLKFLHLLGVVLFPPAFERCYTAGGRARRGA